MEFYCVGSVATVESRDMDRESLLVYRYNHIIGKKVVVRP